MKNFGNQKNLQISQLGILWVPANVYNTYLVVLMNWNVEKR